MAYLSYRESSSSGSKGSKDNELHLEYVYYYWNYGEVEVDGGVYIAVDINLLFLDRSFFPP